MVQIKKLIEMKKKSGADYSGLARLTILEKDEFSISVNKGQMCVFQMDKGEDWKCSGSRVARL